MSLTIALALAAAPVTAAAPEPAPAPAKTEVAKKAAVDPLAAIGPMLKIIDLLFPAGPEPDPARLAIARETTTSFFPKGAYAEAMVGFMDRTAERVLDMSEADFAAMFPDDPEDTKKKGKKAKKPKAPPSTEPLRVKLAREDPQFDAKKAAIKAFATSIFTKIGDAAEPKLREGFARSLARKFDAAQLKEIDAFLATPTGRAYGQQMIGMWFDNDVMRGMFDLIPEMIKMAPDLAGDFAMLESQMKKDKKGGDDKK